MEPGPAPSCPSPGGVGCATPKMMWERKWDRRARKTPFHPAGLSHQEAPPYACFACPPPLQTHLPSLHQDVLSSCPGATTPALSKAQGQAATLLRGASVQQRSKSRPAYQTRSSLKFYGPDSIINELAVPHRRARPGSRESEALRARRVFSRRVRVERVPLGSSPRFATC